MIEEFFGQKYNEVIFFSTVHRDTQELLPSWSPARS